MKIHTFGKITPKSLTEKTGIRLASYVKEDMMNSNSLQSAMKIYGQVYDQLDKILYDLNNATLVDESSFIGLQSTRDEINIFFDMLSNNDVFDSVWKLDSARGANRLFKDIDYNSAIDMFPFMLRFFDTFHGGDFTDIRNKLNGICLSQDKEKFVLDHLTNNTDKDPVQLRNHLTKKYLNFKLYSKKLDAVKK